MESLKPFETYLNEHDCAILTVRGYLADLEHFAIWFEQTNAEPLSPKQLTPIDVKAYKQHLLVAEHRKASTVNRHLASLSAYAKWALATGQIYSDPTSNVKAVKQVANAPKWLDKQAQYALQRAIDRDLQLSKLRYPKRWITRRRDASLVLILLNTGLRLSELIAMRLSDIQLTERKGSLLVQKGKGCKQRSIPLNTTARKAIQEWLAIRPKTESEYVWVAVEGETEGLSGRAVQRILQRYAQESNLDELTPHICRHTFAKNLVNQEIGLEKIGTLLGHSNLNTTRVYVTPDTHDLEFAVEKLN